MHEGMKLRYPEERYVAISEYEADHVPTVLTSGTTLQQRNGIRRSEVVLNSQLCWYLDAAFCHRFHASDGGGEWYAVVFVCSLSFVLGCLCCLCLLRPVCTATAACHDEPLARPPVVSARCDAAVRNFARLPLPSLLVAIYCLAAAPVFYVFVSGTAMISRPQSRTRRATSSALTIPTSSRASTCAPRRACISAHPRHAAGL